MNKRVFLFGQLIWITDYRNDIFMSYSYLVGYDSR